MAPPGAAAMHQMQQDPEPGRLPEARVVTGNDRIKAALWTAIERYVIAEFEVDRCRYDDLTDTRAVAAERRAHVDGLLDEALGKGERLTVEQANRINKQATGK